MYHKFDRRFMQFVNMQIVAFQENENRTPWENMTLGEIAAPFSKSYMDLAKQLLPNTADIDVPALFKDAANLCNWVFILCDKIDTLHAAGTLTPEVDENQTDLLKDNATNTDKDSK